MRDLFQPPKLEEACRYRIDFRWLLGGPAPDHSTLAPVPHRTLKEAVEDLFYQFVRKLEEAGKQTTKRCSWTGQAVKAVRDGTPLCGGKAWKNQLARIKRGLKI